MTGERPKPGITVQAAAAAAATTGAERALAANPDLMIFAVQLALSSGNASEAARQLGWSETRGRKLVARYPGLRDVAARAVEAQAGSVVHRWTDMHDRALKKIDALMQFAEDEQVSLKAALSVVERVEGRVPVKIDIDTSDPKDAFASVTMRFVTAYHLAQGVSVASALLFADKNPELVEEWGRKHGLLAAEPEPTK